MPTADWRALWGRMFPEPRGSGSPSFSRFSTPHHFNPTLGLAGGLVALAAALSRIAAFCVVFAVWGVMALLAWSRIASPLWRWLAAVPILLALPAALIPPMLAIAAIERRIMPRC